MTLVMGEVQQFAHSQVTPNVLLTATVPSHAETEHTGFLDLW